MSITETHGTKFIHHGTIGQVFPHGIIGKKSNTSISSILLSFIVDPNITLFEQIIAKDPCLSIMYYTIHFPAYNHIENGWNYTNFIANFRGTMLRRIKFPMRRS